MGNPPDNWQFCDHGGDGDLMFFHLDSGLNKLLHEWAGWIMVAAVLAHVVLNWRAFKTYFKRPMALGITLSAVAVLCLSFIPANTGGGGPVPLVMGALTQAPVEQVIAVAGLDTATGFAKLAEGGYVIEMGGSINEATGGDRGASMAVLKVLFAD